MMNRFGTRICILASLLLFVASSVNAQSFEGQATGSWYAIDNDFYTTTGEISDSVAFDGTYSVRLENGDDHANGALVNDDVEVAPGDSIVYHLWIAEGQLNQVSAVQPFLQWNSFGEQDFSVTIDASSLAAGEWNEISYNVPEDADIESTSRVGVQVNGNSESVTPSYYLDYIIRFPADGGDQEFLPVELTAFNAVRNGNDVTLNWQTASETNNAGFEVEQRRTDGPWEQVGFVDGHGSTTEIQTYSYSLTDLSAGHYTFRLRQVDLDGTAEYSSEVTVQVRPNRALDLSSATPNPFQEQTRFTLSVSERQDVRVDVFNTLGQRVAVLHDGPVAAGSVQSLTLESSDLSSGVYFVRGQSESHSVTRRIEIVR